MGALGKQLRRHGHEASDRPAVYARGRWWTYGELVRDGERVARELALAPGDVAAVLADRGIEPVIAICAAALADAVPATIDPNDRALAAGTLAALRPTVAIAADPAFGPTCDVLTQRGERVELARRAEAPAWEPVRRPGIAHIIFTSGTTSEAKGVVWSESRAGFDWGLRAPPPLHRDAPGAIAVPLSAAFGLQDLLRSLYEGVATVLLDPPFPVGVEQARELGVNRIKLTPTHAAMLAASADELPALRAVVIGAAPISAEQIDELARHVPNARIARSYGLTEAGAGTAVWRDRHPRKMHSVGRAISMRSISVRARDGKVLPPRTWGEVVIEVPIWDRGDGYLDAPPELDRRFRNARLWTGDRGMLDPQGFLILGPRVAEILKVGGRSTSAPRIEQQLVGLGGIGEVVVVGVADRVLGEAPCAVYVPGPGCDPAELARRARAVVREDEVPRWFLPRPELPRNANGKVRRGLVSREAAAWTQTFTATIALGHRLSPAYFVDDDVMVVDGGPDPELPEAGSIDPRARVLALVGRGARRVLAVGSARAAPDARVVVGPIAVARRPRIAVGLLDVFAGELIRLARLLPGPPASTEHAFAERALAFEAAGFAAVAGESGWLQRGADAGLADDTRREATAFTAWAGRVRDAAAAGLR